MRTLLLSACFLLSCTRMLSQQLVLPGDHPDPSVVKIGNQYWASATTSNWFPAYPLYHSTDLVHWQADGFVFNQLPEWADYYFWAPEITYDRGKVYVYYAAHKKGGNLCVGAAVADKPEGPYKDLGPLMCQEDGSIDAFPMRDENGKLYLIWKEDGNSIKQPTPIWAQEMKEDRTALVGEKKELFRNTAPWEEGLVEGVSMIRHGDYFYAIYAAAGCCNTGCNYQTGVARAKSLLGPWEKWDRNPILGDNETWKCPGHGTPVQKNGRYYFLYHAYNTQTTVYAGRQGLLREFQFTPDGWISFLPRESFRGVKAPTLVQEKFAGTGLSTKWQWSVFKKVDYTLRNGTLTLHALPDASGAYLGQTVLMQRYKASALLDLRATTAQGGLAAIGDDKNMVSVTVKDSNLIVAVLQNNQETIAHQEKLSAGGQVYLAMEVSGNTSMMFSWSPDGKTYHPLNPEPVNGAFLPPWDRAVRIGLVAKGSEDLQAVFKGFTLQNF